MSVVYTYAVRKGNNCVMQKKSIWWAQREDDLQWESGTKNPAFVKAIQ